MPIVKMTEAKVEAFSQSLWLFRVKKQPVKQFQRKNPVNLVSVVPISFDVVSHHHFQIVFLPIGAGKGARVKQHFANIVGQGIPVPHSEMVIPVPAQKKALQVERSRKMIDSSHPLGHPMVVGVVRLESKIVV